MALFRWLRTVTFASEIINRDEAVQTFNVDSLFIPRQYSFEEIFVNS